MIFEHPEKGKEVRTSYLGLPQGSSLSSLMNSVYTRGFHGAVGPLVKAEEFADDVTIRCMHKCVEVATSRVQEALIIVLDFFDSIELTVLITKTAALVFSRKHAVVLLSLEIDSHSIWSLDPCITLLGVKLDRKLLWQCHTRYVWEKCQ